jgi:glycosyltransferase involved in cell wall biosynthesis
VIMHFSSGEQIVSVIIPCLNEEEPIGLVVREVLAQNVDEVVVVDNGSTDRTATAFRPAEHARPYPRSGSRTTRAPASAARSAEIVCFLDGDVSDVPDFLPQVVRPVADGEADFVMGSRLRGRREAGSMTPHQIVAGWLAGFLLRLTYGVRFTDMSPFRAMRVDRLRTLKMTEQTYGWNLEMQMRAAASRCRILEIPVDHRCRRGGVSKVSGNLVAGAQAGWKIVTTFLRLATSPRVA